LAGALLVLIYVPNLTFSKNANEMSSLLHFLNVSLFFLVITVSVLLLDFVLPATRKKAIDDCIETLTLRLSYMNTVDWLRRWLQATRRAEIAQIVFNVLGLLIFLVCWVGKSVELFKSDHPYLAIPEGLVFGALVTWIVLLPVSIIFKHVGQPLMKKVAETESLAEFTSQFFAVVIGGLILLLCCLGTLTWISSDSSFVRGLQIWLWGAITTWVFFFLDGLLTYIGVAIVILLRFVVETARFLTWKIATFPKGPTTAITTLLTVTITILKFMLGK
jgi:hypothetical protein